MPHRPHSAPEQVSLFSARTGGRALLLIGPGSGIVRGQRRIGQSASDNFRLRRRGREPSARVGQAGPALTDTDRHRMSLSRNGYSGNP